MAIKQIVPIFITLQGDGAATTFVFPVQNLYQLAFSGSVPFGITGSIPSSVVVNNTPFPVTSATVDANGNITITFTSAPPASSFNIELDVVFNSGSATSTSPTVSQNVTLTGTSTVSVSGTINENLIQLNSVALGSPSNYGTSPGAVSVMGVNAFITNTPAVTVSGTVGVTQSTSPWVVSLTSTTITGTVAVTQSTSPWVVAGGLTNNNAAPAANNVGVLPAIASTAVQAYTTGDQVLLNTTLAGATRIDQYSHAGTALGAPSNYGTSPGAVSVQGVNAFVTNTVAVTMTSTTITGTVAVTQSTSPWVVNMTQWASTTLGTPTNFGTTPTAVIAGSVNASLFIGTTAARSNQTTTATGVQDVNIVGSLGATNSVTNGTFMRITDNTTGAGVIAGTTALKTDMSSVAGTATVTAAAGIQKVGISGATGVTLDAVITAATSPANGVMGLSVYQATQPALTTGQSVALQNDSAGNLQVSYGCNVTTGAAWATGTALNTAQYISGTATIGTPIGKPAVVVQLNQTTTLTAGAVTFEGTYDGTNWVTIPVAQVVHPETFLPLTNPYTFVASTNAPFMILMQGYQNIRLRLSTAITGTGSVTPQWDSRNHAPLQSISVTASPSGGTNLATGSIGATKTAVKTTAGAVYGWYFYNSNSAVAYVQLFANTVAGVTLGTTAPTLSLGIPPGSAANMAFDVGLQFATAITIAITTGRANAASPTNSVDYNVFYL